jgi:hypothetical protein
MPRDRIGLKRRGKKKEMRKKNLLQVMQQDADVLLHAIMP